MVEMCNLLLHLLSSFESKYFKKYCIIKLKAKVKAWISPSILIRDTAAYVVLTSPKMSTSRSKTRRKCNQNCTIHQNCCVKRLKAIHLDNVLKLRFTH